MLFRSPISTGLSAGTIAQGDSVAVTVMRAGPIGSTGIAGSDGGVKFTYDSTTTMAAPASGGLRFNNATIGSATQIAIAATTAETGNPSVSAWINTWDDSSSTVRGQIVIRKQTTGVTVAVFNVTGALTDNASWLQIPVANVTAPTTLSNGDPLLVSFYRTGDKGADGVNGAGSGTVTSVGAGAGLSAIGVGGTGGSVTSSGTLTNVRPVNPQIGTTYVFVAGDHAKLVTFANAAAIAASLSQATSTFGAGWFVDVVNFGPGVLTITPTTSTINGQPTLVLNRLESARIISDGTNYQAQLQGGPRGQVVTAASASTCDIGAIASHRVSITGTTTITSFGSAPNQIRFGSFTGVLTLTHNATSLILPGAASITTAASDTFIASSDASGNWTVIAYQKANGQAVVGGAGGGSAGPQGQCRLIKSGANLVLLPFGGNQLTINGTAQAVPDAGVSLAPTSLTASTTYYIYAFLSGATMTLEASSTGHATDTTTGNKGVEIKSGDSTRTLVGMARVVTGPAWVDTDAQRFVISWFNRRTITTTNIFTASRNSTTGATYTEVNSEIRNEFLTWADESVAAGVGGSGFLNVTGDQVYVGLGFDGATPEQGNLAFQGTTAIGPLGLYLTKSGLSDGYHYATLTAKQTIGSSAFTFVSGASGQRCALSCSMRG